MLEQLVGPGELKFEIRQQSEGVGGRWQWLDVLKLWTCGLASVPNSVILFFIRFSSTKIIDIQIHIFRSSCNPSTLKHLEDLRISWCFWWARIAGRLRIRQHECDAIYSAKDGAVQAWKPGYLHLHVLNISISLESYKRIINRHRPLNNPLKRPYFLAGGGIGDTLRFP